MFIKTSLKTQKMFKKLEIIYRKAIISVFFDMAKFANFWRKSTDVIRTQGLFHVINIFFGSSFGKE